MLMIEDTDIDNMTKREIEMLKSYIDENPVHSLSARITFTPEERKIVDEINHEITSKIFKVLNYKESRNL